MKNKKAVFVVIAILIILIIYFVCFKGKSKGDEWYNYDGSPIVCRKFGCDRTPLYSEWDMRFCSEHMPNEVYGEN